MGNPQHFSLEVSKRAHQLLRDFYEHLENAEGTSLPLKATFLLSVSMPIVILPIERILKYLRPGGNVHMNDAALNMRLANAVDGAIDLTAPVSQAPFYAGAWQYAELPRGAGFPNLAAGGLPAPVADALDLPDATTNAQSLPANRFCKILRNALAHGGVLYLDQHGRSSQRSPVTRFAFVSLNDPVNPTKSLFLRATMGDYRLFLQQWVNWLQEAAVEAILADDLGLGGFENDAAIISDEALA